MTSPTSNTSRPIPCEGWWDQKAIGRQPMHDLYLKFDSGTIAGGGADIIGLFTLHGTIDEQGRVAMRKQYLGQHSVDYYGTYDGEGLLWGEWNILGFKDRWMIKLKSARSSAAEPLEVAIVAD
jgi:hypothetical protein